MNKSYKFWCWLTEQQKETLEKEFNITFKKLNN